MNLRWFRRIVVEIVPTSWQLLLRWLIIAWRSVSPLTPLLIIFVISLSLLVGMCQVFALKRFRLVYVVDSFPIFVGPVLSARRLGWECEFHMLGTYDHQKFSSTCLAAHRETITFWTGSVGEVGKRCHLPVEWLVNLPMARCCNCVEFITIISPDAFFGIRGGRMWRICVSAQRLDWKGDRYYLFAAHKLSCVHTNISSD